jgi:hypothetical protein
MFTFTICMVLDHSGYWQLANSDIAPFVKISDIFTIYNIIKSENIVQGVAHLSSG